MPLYSVADSNDAEELEPPIAQTRNAGVGNGVYTSIDTSGDERDENATEKQSTNDAASKASAIQRLQLRWVDGWAAEILSCVFSVIAIACLVATLRYFDGSVITEVPLKISINALVAILAGVAKSALLLPVAEGISQSKWLWFSKSRRLIDFEKFDCASRGPWGSLMLVFRLRSRYVAALGAWITLLALAIDPFTQQIIRPVVCDRTLDGVFGKIPRANNLTEYDPKIPSNTKGLEISMLAAIYNGLVEVAGSIDVQCPTGNCTFNHGLDSEPSYQTLGFESACVDVSKEVRAETIDFSMSTLNTWYMPNTGINSSATNASITHDYEWSQINPGTIFRVYNDTRLVATLSKSDKIYFPSYWIKKQNTTPLVSFTALLFNTEKSSCKLSTCPKSRIVPVAVECRIWPSVLTMKSHVESSKLHDTIVTSEPLQAYQSGYQPGTSDVWLSVPAQVLRDGHWEPCTGSPTYTANTPVAVYQTSVHDTQQNGLFYGQVYDHFRKNMTWHARDCVWTVDRQAVTALRNTFSRMFDNQTLFSSNGQDTSYSRGEPWIKTLYLDGKANLSTIETYASQIAQLMTNQTRRLRSMNDPEFGFAKANMVRTETCIHVRWSWIVFPVCLVVLTIVFLAATMWQTRESGRRARQCGVWKSSSLAVLFGGLEGGGIVGIDKQSNMERRAKEMRVALRLRDDGWRLG